MQIDLREAALACANEACRNMTGELDLDAMTRHFEQAAGLPTQQFFVGKLTMAGVFEAKGLTNLNDMQAVLDAVEEALANRPIWMGYDPGQDVG